jgi:HPt (histidine-containing phosphotransfer) domain-containing protein
MNRAVDFDSFSEITGGNAAFEAELFPTFLASASEFVAALRAAQASGDENAWHRQAHAFKGICYNLCAGPLGELCKKAQDDFHATPEEKKLLLTEIEKELGHVREALESRCSANPQIIN